MANPHEHQLHYPFGDRMPELGESQEVAPGVRWLRMKLPFALDHINLWLLRDERRGPRGLDGGGLRHHHDATREAWEQVFASAELEGLPVLRVIVTHMHPDHIGLAHWLCERWSTPGTTAGCGSAAPTGTPHAWPRNHHGLRRRGRGGFFASHGLTDPRRWSKVRQRQLLRQHGAEGARRATAG
jgi:glyoxylase-like metal-dependent hydrolase (beta-lactamase superfamily II)